MNPPSYIVAVILVAISYTATGQKTLTLLENPVDEGDNVTGTCADPAGTSGLDVAVNGVVDGGGIMSTVIITARQTDFVLPNVTRAANGFIFTCVQVELDTIIFGNVTLVVNFAPNYTVVLADQEINKGNPLTITFNLDAQPKMGDNFNYTWTKDGEQFTSSSNVAVTATSISITSAACNDSGLYSVTATNLLGSDSVSFRLAVLCPPKFEAGSNPVMIDTITGQNFTINCRVTESYPTNPMITLTTQGSVPTDVTANPSQAFRQNQAGTYTYVCRANNTRATVNLTYQVSVAMSPTNPSTGPPTTTPSPTSAAPPNLGPSIGLIIGVVVGVSVLACVISILVPVLICCCLGVGVFATIGCLAKNKKKEDIEVSKL